MSGSIPQLLAAPLEDPLVRRALAEVVLLGLAGGALGCWVTIHRLSYSAESLAHGLLPGLVVASVAGLPLLLGAGVGIAIAAVAIALTARVEGIGGDTAVAVVVTTLLGAGALLALAPSTRPGLARMLFGDPLGVADSDLVLAAGLVAALAVALPAMHQRLLIVGFDRAAAPALGVRPGLVDLALLALVAATLVVAVQGLGNLLVVAVLIAPATAARRMCRRVASMIPVSAAIAAGAGVAGIYVSFYADVAAGGAIALAMLAAVAVTALLPARASR